jgi:rare lipoprotein A
MKPFVLALCVAAVTATAQAQTADQRGSQTSRRATAARQAQSPSPVSALLKWLHDKTQPTPAKAADKAAPAKVAEKPKPVPARTHPQDQAQNQGHRQVQREGRHREARHQGARHHREKPVDDADAAPPVVTMTLASAPPAAPAADTPATAVPAAAPVVNPAAVAPVTDASAVAAPPVAPAVTPNAALAPAAPAVAGTKAAVAPPATRSINPDSAVAAAPVADALAVMAPPAPAPVATTAAGPPAVSVIGSDAAGPPPPTPTVTRTAAVAPAATPDTPRDPAMPRAVATLTVTPQTFKPKTGGYHSCTSGERIITAFYWEGKHTASGERFDPDRFAAAHRSLPFGTRLLITNPRTGKSVTVTVNDRGPFVKGVTLDLTRGAAKAIGMQGTGAVCMAKL